MAQVSPVGIGHKATDLLRTPFVHQLACYPANQAGQSLCHFLGGTSSLTTCRLSCVSIATGSPVALYLAANGSAVNTNVFSDLALANTGLKIGKNWVSLALG